MIGVLKSIRMNPDGAQDITLTLKGIDFRQEFDRLKDSDVRIEIKKASKHRSLDANALAWVLIDRIAEHMGEKKSTVYRNAIRDIGGVSTTVCVIEKAADTLCRNWQEKGIGWQAEMFDSKIPGCKNVTLWYGSSTYDSKQMSDLISALIQDAEALGIPTISDEERDKALSKWKKEDAA